MAVVELTKRPAQPRPKRTPAEAGRRTGRGMRLDLALLLSLLTGAVTHGYNLFNYPLYITDEGIYIQQAWSVLREARLSPYTYFYDHAPAGWLAIGRVKSICRCRGPCSMYGSR